MVPRSSATLGLPQRSGHGVAAVVAAATLLHASGVLHPAAASSAPGIGNCLGDHCERCHAIVEALPRAPRAAAARHLDTSKAGPSELLSFVSAPEICRVEELFPLSLDRDFWSLSALTGGDGRLRFHGAASFARAASAACTAAVSAAVDALSRALQAAGACVGTPLSSAALIDDRMSQDICNADGARSEAKAVAARWRSTVGGATRSVVSEMLTQSWFEEDANMGFVASLGNETMAVLEHYTARIWRTFILWTNRDEKVPEALNDDVDALAPNLATYRRLVQLAVELSKQTRLMMSHLQLAWGIRDLSIELASVYPQIAVSLPRVAFVTEVYGRHWDVLEWLLLGLRRERSDNRRADVLGDHESEVIPGAPRLKMLELGVACGPIGLFLLLRFPELNYVGADPTIRQSVRDAYVRFGDRARLRAQTSAELHEELPGDETFDFVFIDGPHTYGNVRNDIKLWLSRVRRGGIIAGHDFTAAHPPLLWAVLEQRMLMAQESASTLPPIRVGMDGVWWLRVD
eukprot:TRINITY_DN1627_c0_g1_i1.p1 TRINITY_DN1627_c0_g1~~TRINITY_DN1627_c0_g1_i1.p1  ORF type:complete len:553 (-),score=77.70 TRINITY_DN1627_c0_g1_i1:152-1705(-)